MEVAHDDYFELLPKPNQAPVTAKVLLDGAVNHYHPFCLVNLIPLIIILRRLLQV